MGCDFYYDGNLPDEGLQGKVINFVKGYFDKIDLVITPDLACTYPTEINLPSSGYEYNPQKKQFDEYSFNFYGIIPQCRDEYGINDYGQFIFDRNNNGRLVKLRRLPDSFEIIPHYYYQEKKESKPIDWSGSGRAIILGRVELSVNAEKTEPQTPEPAQCKYQVIVDDGGYIRLGGGLGFALLLTICKLRWWPELTMSDDYENCEIVDALLAKFGLHRQLMDESLDFDACHKLFIADYHKEFPPAPTGDMKLQAQWYLDFTDKIKPYMKVKGRG